MRARKCSSEAIEDPRLELVFHMFGSNGRATVLNVLALKKVCGHHQHYTLLLRFGLRV